MPNMIGILVGSFCIFTALMPDPDRMFLGSVPWNIVNTSLIIMGLLSFAVAFFTPPN